MATLQSSLPTWPEQRKLAILLPLLPIVIFLAFQAALMLTVDLPDYDEAVYLNVARSIRRTGIAYRPMGTGLLYTEHTPLYQYFLAIGTLIFGERLVVLRLLTVLFAVGTILLCFIIGRKLVDELTGLAAALLVAINSFFILYSYFLREEVPMVFFLLLASFFLVKELQSRQEKYLVHAGVAVAVAVLFKEVALVFLFAAAIYTIADRISWRARLRRCLKVVTPAVVVLLIWFTWLISIHPRWLRAALDRWFNSALGTGLAVQDFRTGTTLVEWLNTIGDVVLGWETVLLLLVALLAWFFGRRKSLPRITALFLFYPLLATGLSILIRLKEPRHIIGIIPFVALSISLLIEWKRVISWLAHGKRKWLLVAAGACLFLLAWTMSPLRLPRNESPQETESWWEPLFVTRMYGLNRYYGILQTAGAYLAEHTPPDEIIVVVHEGTAVSYYADRSYQFLYTSNYDQVMSALENARTLVYDRESFFLLSESERAAVQEYIHNNFSVDQVFKDDYRQVVIYRRSR